MTSTKLESLGALGVERLECLDPSLSTLLEREIDRQATTLSMVASSSLVDPSVLACQASAAVNVTAEGYPGARFHAGCAVIDEIEQLAIDRAKRAFGARYANVQPHSASTANEIVYFSLLQPGDTILGMQLDSGGHLTHGARVSISGRHFNAVGYGLDHRGYIDFEQVRDLALTHRPKLIICGATAYTRKVDFARFREIADEAGALLLADISHIAGLVVTGLHPSPIDHAHFTTTCTHKQLFGPRGGLIMIGRDADTLVPRGTRTLAETIQRGVFPLAQGAPILNAIAAKARMLAIVQTREFAAVAQRIVDDSRALAEQLIRRGYRVLTAGTDNHIVVVDVDAAGVSGLVAERALESCGIVVNKNRIPGDQKPPTVTSGVRLGTNGLAWRGLGPDEMGRCVELIHRVVTSVRPHGDREYTIAEAVRESVRTDVAELCAAFPIPGYPLPTYERALAPVGGRA
ncbi:MAG: serine hydroxymethyltransferase [Chloroflexota bacterium]